MTLVVRAAAMLILSCLFFVAAAGAQDGPTTSSVPVVSVQEASEALIQVLKDPDSRSALIEQLQQMQTRDGADSKAAEAVPDTGQPSGTSETSEASTLAAEQVEDADSSNFALRLGKYTKLIADDFASAADRVGHSLKGLSLLASGELQVRWRKAADALIQVTVVLVAALIAFFLGQKILVTLFKRYAVKVRYGGWLTRTFFLALTTVADGLTVILGWGAGYTAALIEFGGLETGVSLLESLALNAFLVTGLAKVALRFVFAPERPVLRLLPFEDKAAIYWSKRLGFVTSWIGYGLMLGVPVANLAVSFVIGNAVRFFVVLIAAVLVLVLVHRNRLSVSAGTADYAEKLQSALAKRAMMTFAKVWHVGAYVYVLAVFAVWLFRPFDAVAIVMRATGLSVLTIMGGMLISLVVTRAITGGIRLPAGIRQSLPALQYRLNAFVPRILKLVRLVVFVVTVLLLLEIWNVASVFDWVRSPSGAALVNRYSSAVLVLFAAFVIWLGVMSWVDLKLRAQAGYVVTARVRTLFQLFRNAFTVVIIVMAVLLSLSEIGIDIGPLIAGAGVVGLAISFGAQTLVKDIITGAFIQIENAINEGDVVTVGGITGTVEGLTVRSARLRDLDGTTHIIPFSSVDMVSNFMRDFGYHVALIGVSYDTDIKHAKMALAEAFERLKQSEHGTKVIGDLEMHGVTNFGASSIDIRSRIKTTPGDQWGVGRAYNEFVKQVFDEESIEIPFPQVTYHAAQPPALTGEKSALALKAERSKDAGSRTSAADADGPSHQGD